MANTQVEKERRERRRELTVKRFVVLSCLLDVFFTCTQFDTSTAKVLSSFTTTAFFSHFVFLLHPGNGKSVFLYKVMLPPTSSYLRSLLFFKVMYHLLFFFSKQHIIHFQPEENRSQ